MFNVARKLIDWSDKKYDEAIREDKGYKAFISGMAEGFADASIVLYVPVVIAFALWGHEAMKK